MVAYGTGTGGRMSRQYGDGARWQPPLVLHFVLVQSHKV